jgi:hypothetical protein
VLFDKKTIKNYKGHQCPNLPFFTLKDKYSILIFSYKLKQDGHSTRKKSCLVINKNADKQKMNRREVIFISHKTLLAHLPLHLNTSYHLAHLSHLLYLTFFPTFPT